MNTMKQAAAWPLIIGVAGLAVLLTVTANLSSPFRPVLVFGFMLICPGMAFVRLLHLNDRWTEVCLALGLSLALDTLVSEILVLLRIWSLVGCVFVIVLLSIGGAMLQLIAALRATAMEVQP